jgi:hypothetical protein
VIGAESSTSNARASRVCEAIAVSEVIDRWRAAAAFVIAGSVCVVIGGVVAAFSGPTDFERGSWLAAYLVLVGGVAQIALGGGQAWLAQRVPSARTTRAEVWWWNAAVVVVVIGTFASVPILTSIGALALAVAVGLFLAGVRKMRPAPRGARWCYRGVAGVILVSIPVGVVLAWVRHG